jgi:hypothetical protein
MRSIIYHKEIPSFLLPYTEAEEMQRLKKVDMNCGMNFTSVPLFQKIEPYTRYEHSLGVALIIYHFTQNRPQSLSGLFHDISTPAFSHVIDFMNGDALKQESTEDKTLQILKDSKQITGLLKMDHLDLCQVSDYHRYPIADNDSPKLSSDRLEYTIGAAIDYGFATAEQLQPLYDDIVVGTNEHHETELVFQHEEKALQFGLYALRNGDVFTSKEDRYCMERLAMLVRKAMQAEILNEKDIYTDEEHVVGILLNSELSQQWQEYRQIAKVITSSEPKEGWIQIAAKKRYIDPYCLETRSRLSQSSAVFKQKTEAFLAMDHQEWMKGIA